MTSANDHHQNVVIHLLRHQLSHKQCSQRDSYYIIHIVNTYHAIIEPKKHEKIKLNQ